MSGRPVDGSPPDKALVGWALGIDREPELMDWNVMVKTRSAEAAAGRGAGFSVDWCGHRGVYQHFGYDDRPAGLLTFGAFGEAVEAHIGEGVGQYLLGGGAGLRQTEREGRPIESPTTPMSSSRRWKGGRPGDLMGSSRRA